MSTCAHRPLLAAEIGHFRSQGYLVVRGLFNAQEIEALQLDVARLQREGRLVDLLASAAAAPAGGQAGAAAQPAVNLQLCPMSPHSVLVAALRWHPEVVRVVSDLIGDPALFLLDQVFIKPPRHGAGTDWHQDHAYFAGGDPLLGVGMWVPLQGVSAQHGTMQVVPGSHLQPAAHERDPRSHVLIRARVQPDLARSIDLEAGDALFFGFGLLHATQDNRSDRERGFPTSAGHRPAPACWLWRRQRSGRDEQAVPPRRPDRLPRPQAPATIRRGHRPAPGEGFARAQWHGLRHRAFCRLPAPRTLAAHP
jgi:phytanoyl-CoA hydroxylase